MRTETARVNIFCDQCGQIIFAGERYAIKQVPVKNLFYVPAE